jgi:hypothetical protein
MVDLKGEHQCFVCNRGFQWIAFDADPMGATQFRVHDLTGVKANFVASGKGEFEMTAKCPQCNIVNKFVHK